MPSTGSFSAKGALESKKQHAQREVVRFRIPSRTSGFRTELRIAHWRKKENGKQQSSDRLCKTLTKYLSPAIEASSGAH
jgi:hypothetical protein